MITESCLNTAPSHTSLFLLLTLCHFFILFFVIITIDEMGAGVGAVNMENDGKY